MGGIRENRELLPVRPRGGERLDDHRSVRASGGNVGHAARNRPRLTATEGAALARDLEVQRALDDEPELLVRMLMLRDGRAGCELDESERLLLAVDPPDDNTGRNLTCRR